MAHAARLAGLGRIGDYLNVALAAVRPVLIASGAYSRRRYETTADRLKATDLPGHEGKLEAAREMVYEVGKTFRGSDCLASRRAVETARNCPHWRYWAQGSKVKAEEAGLKER